MKRFTFELERVLKFKQRREQVAEVQQKQAAAALQAAKVEARALGEQLDRVCLGLQQKLGKPQNTTTWMAVYLQSARLQQALQTAVGKVESAAQLYDRAALARKQAAVEVEMLVTLRQRKWQVHCRDMQLAAQEQLDELGLRRWQAARAGQLGDSDTQGAQT
jgi:flagellar export protein FliJ